MRVKELAEILKISVDELMGLLANVGVSLNDQENSMVDSNTEKKLAKKFNVPYPFKTAKPKAPKAAPVKAVSTPTKPVEKKAEQVEEKKTAPKPVQVEKTQKPEKAK